MSFREKNLRKYLEDTNVVNMVISSIIDHPEDWTIEYVSGNPTIHVHKSGISIWAYLNANQVKFQKPKYAQSIQIPSEEKKLLFNAIQRDRFEKIKNIRAKVVKRLVRQFTKSEPKSWFAKLFN